MTSIALASVPRNGVVVGVPGSGDRRMCWSAWFRRVFPSCWKERRKGFVLDEGGWSGGESSEGAAEGCPRQGRHRTVLAGRGHRVRAAGGSAAVLAHHPGRGGGLVG